MGIKWQRTHNRSAYYDVVRDPNPLTLDYVILDADGERIIQVHTTNYAGHVLRNMGYVPSASGGSRWVPR